MKAINKKLWRETWAIRGQALAIALIIACGIAIYVMSLSTLDALRTTRSKFYREHHFAEVFASLKRAPDDLKSRIMQIPGVDQVETRVKAPITVEIENFPEPVTGLLVSIPDDGKPLLNQLYLKSGRMIDPYSDNEILISDSFAEAHGLVPGDDLVVIINGRKKKLQIVGIAISPEYIYQIAPGALIPDYKRYGIFWMGRTPLSAAYNMEGAFNDIVLTLSRKSREENVIDRLDKILEPYGSLGAYGRDDQTSYKYLSEEFKQLSTIATILPIIFLGVAAFLLNVVISRLIRIEQQIIAVLKAFGYSNFDVGLHYIKQIMLIVIAGLIIGTALGIWAGHAVGMMYMHFFRLPYLIFRLKPLIVLTAFLVSAAAALIGTIYSVSKATLLPPAIAMRPEPPTIYRVSMIERLGLKRIFAQPTRMIFRHLERTPFKSLMTVMGIAFACSILVLGRFAEDAIDYEMAIQFNKMQRGDLAITFFEPSSRRSLYELEHLQGAKYGEIFRAVSAKLRYGHRSYRTAVQGIQPDGDLNRLMDTQMKLVKLPEEGIVLSEYLGNYLHIRTGDTLTVEVLEGARPTKRVVVDKLVNQFVGVGAYMDIAALNRLMKEGHVISGVYLAADNKYLNQIYTDLRDRPKVAEVTIMQQVRKQIFETFGEMILVYTFIVTIFAGVIAFGVVYNSARISLSERSREMASLRVLGFTRAEISYILLGELAILTFVAVPIGFFIGYGLAAYLIEALKTDLYRVPLIIGSRTYSFAALVVLVSATVSGFIVRHRLDHLDLVEVLKTRE